MTTASQSSLHVWLPLIRTGTGSEVYTHLLAQGLRERGHTATISEAPHIFQYAPWLAPIRPPDGAQVVLANSWNAAAFVRHGLPVISVCHLVVHDDRLRPFKSLAQTLFHRYFVLPMEKAAVRKAAVNVAVSPLVARQMQTYLNASGVVTVNNGVDTDYFTPGPAREREPDEPLRLLFVGKPSLRKGFDIVAEIVEQIGDKATFTCAGVPPEQGLPRPPGTYTGHLDREALREEYRKADLLLFPSRMEGLSLAAAEAMASGLPILAARGSAIDEFITDDCGFVRDEDDIDGFILDIESIVADKRRLAPMRQAARVRAEAELSAHRWLDEMEQLLTAAARRPRSL